MEIFKLKNPFSRSSIVFLQPKCFKIVDPNSMVEMKISRTVQAGAANIFVALPGAEHFPDKEVYDWRAGQGSLYGPPGTFLNFILFPA